VEMKTTWREREMTERMKEKQNRPEPTIKSREMAVVEQNHNTRTINSFKIAKLYISTSMSLDYENQITIVTRKLG